MARFTQELSNASDIADFIFTNNGTDSTATLPGDKDMSLSSGSTSDLFLTAGHDTYLTGGRDVFIESTVDDIHLGSNDDITLSTNINDPLENHSWRFNSEGGLVFPDNTVQTTAYTAITGSWTVTTGTNTYNFTLPSNGTYTMWVNGNIPNGIIVWNATVTVTNANVPAIGSQYAWNYTGGGSPILLTAIPNQIKGTAGTISTDATYSGTTSNRFDFTIANTSSASQTVYYGYTKI